jgi:transcriptional regulator with GAF, ATPase, and Fis domain
MTEHSKPADTHHATEREAQIINTFVHLADTLVADYDVIDFLHYLIERCIALVDVDEAGVMLADPHGRLHAVAASTERLRLLELFELQNHDGPCLDAFRSGDPVSARDLNEQHQHWPSFAGEAINIGFRSAHSVPMQLRDETIGAINLLRADVGVLTDTDSKLVSALADIATIGVLQQRRTSAALSTAAALQGALSSRVLIEQAKGVIAERSKISIDEAFDTLRKYARDHQQGLTIVAGQVVDGTLNLIERA